MSIALVNGQYLDSNGVLNVFAELRIESGKITHIGAASQNAADQTIDCQAKIVTPSLTDLSMRMSGTGATSIQRELRAAAAGGIGRACLQPMTKPMNDTPAVAKLIQRNSKQSSGANLIQLGAMTKGLEGSQLSEYAELKDSGCLGLSHGFKAPSNLLVTQRCFEYAETFDLPIFMHPMEPSLYDGSMHFGTISTYMGLKGIPVSAETIAIAQLCMLAENTGVKLHLSQISSAASVKLIRDAKNKGLAITSSVAIANLLYTHDKVTGYNSIYHTIPPLREESDRLALIEGIKDGTIDAIVSGHAPCGVSAKLAPFSEAAVGMSTAEHMLNYALILDHNAELTLAQFITAMNARAAAVLNLPAYKIEEGSIANLCILSTEDSARVNPEDMLSKGTNTPLVGDVKGKVEHTFVDGALAYSA